MLLQILPTGSTSQGFIEFMDEYFPSQCNFIVLEEDESAPVDIYKSRFSNLMVISRVSDLLTNKQCKTWISTADCVVVNWVDGRILMLLARHLSKIALVFWGGDLRSLKDGLKSQRFLERLQKKVVANLIERSSLILTLTPGDYKELCKICSPQGANGGVTIMTLEMSRASFEEFKNIEKNKINVLVGNSATKTNRHEEAFSLLAKFHNLDIYSVLSYGDMVYGKEVEEIGKKIFSNQFHSVTEVMSPIKYREFLSMMDVGIFNNDRQQGMGNIRTLLALGKKVYLSKDNPAFNDLKSEGFSIFDIQNIPNESFEKFIDFSPDDSLKNQRIGSFAHLRDRAIKEWKLVFDYFKK